jgi:hypothetical protein
MWSWQRSLSVLLLFDDLMVVLVGMGRRLGIAKDGLLLLQQLEILLFGDILSVLRWCAKIVLRVNVHLFRGWSWLWWQLCVMLMMWSLNLFWMMMWWLGCGGKFHARLRSLQFSVRSVGQLLKQPEVFWRNLNGK